MDKLIEALKEKLGEDILTEEVTTDLQAQFDVLVNEKVQSLVTTKEAELEENSEAEMTEFKNELIESLDKYIEYASNEYLSENEIAIEAGSKVLVAEKIIEATKNVFKEVGMEIPETELDTFKQMETDLEESTDKLNKVIDENIDSKKQIFEYKKAVAFQKITSDLTESKIEKVHTLLEGLEYNDIEDFDRKVKIVIDKIETKVIKEDNDNNQDDLEDLNEDVKTSSIDKYLV